MALAPKFTEAQKTNLGNIKAGDLLLIYEEPVDNDDDQDTWGSAADAAPQGDQDDSATHINGWGSTSGESDVDGEDRDTNGVEDDGASTPRASTSSQDHATTGDDNETDHAEHVEDVAQVIQAGANDSNDGGPVQSMAEPMWLVQYVARDSSNEIEKIVLVRLTYNAHPGNHAHQTYQLFGNDRPRVCCDEGFTNVSNDDVVRLPDDLSRFSSLTHNDSIVFCPNPAADHVRDVIFDRYCPARCNDGWLPSIESLRGMVPNYNPPTTRTNVPAVCPACMGIGLMQEHQQLRYLLDRFTHANLNNILDFYSRLNPRRELLEYDYDQFDEREWGYLFTDMVEADEGDGNGNGNGNDNGRWEYWAEAMDPNAGVVPQPASEAALEALQVKKYAEVKGEEGEAICAVCREEFKDDSVVVELPCKHYFCADECGKEWLKSSDRCPTCRTPVAVAAAATEVAEEAGEGAAEDGEEDAEKDGEKDVEMMDVD